LRFMILRRLATSLLGSFIASTIKRRWISWRGGALEITQQKDRADTERGE
jgi:hypothetical protein